VKLTELEEYVLGFFLSVDALSVSVDGRYFRREDFVRVFEDRIFYVTQQFGGKIAGRHSNIAVPLVDRLIESNALSTSTDQWSVTWHRFDPSKYRAVVKELIQSNILCQRSKDAGPQFWEEAFAALSNDELQPR
jgi:hypothetical protein